MIALSTNLGRSLVLLAVCLHIVVAAAGGRICLQTAQPPASDACLSMCCDDQESPTDGFWIETDHQQSPVGPADADCCLEVQINYFATTVGVTSMEDSDGSFLALVPNRNRTEIVIRRVNISDPGATHPPPSMAMIRLTVLRL